MMPVALRAQNICKQFGTGTRRAAILQDVGMEVGQGETVFLVGPSGSGKTTLLSVLGCILTPDEGSIQVFDQEVGHLTTGQQAAFRRQHFGFIFQSFNLFPTLSALDNVRLALCMQGTSNWAASRRAKELLDQVGLGRRAHLRPGQLSTGECQRVAVARALANEPAVVFADEPTASLDAENGQNVMRLLTGLVGERGVTLIVVTHDNRIFPFADRILKLEDGRLCGQWRPTPSEAALALVAH